jgi:2-amino-4-hydroxy-6-hydroxymethyldihydropteridine diphosphokinase
MAKVIGVGSNMGDRLGNVRRALEHLRAIGRVSLVSRVYESEPVGFKPQGKFLNLALALETELGPHKLLGGLKAVEEALGRVESVRDGPRVVDLDLLFYDDAIVDDEFLTVPHPRLHLRGFVLFPLADIIPDFIHPILGESVADLLRGLDDRGGVVLFGRL